MRTLRNAALCAAIACCTAGPSAQSLGELAKRASDRPSTAAAKTYTNDDVRLAQPGAPASAATPAAPTPEKPEAEATAAKEPQAAGAPAADEKEKEKPKPPQYVVDRMAEMRVQIDALKEQLSKLETGKEGVAPAASLQTLRDKIANLEKELALFAKRAAAPVPPRR